MSVCAGVSASDALIDEGATLAFTASATDADTPAQTLTYSLLAGAPFSASLDAASGAFTWTPLELQGGVSYPITMKVADNGRPARHATRAFTVTVRKVNSAPALGAVTNYALHQGAALAVPHAATDPDFPTNLLTFSLRNPPDGASIDPVSGLFLWTPAPAHAGSTNEITVVVTDNGSPPRSDEKTFQIIVAARPALGAVQFTVGGVQITWSALAGRTYRVQYSGTLGANDWIDLPGDVMATGETATSTDSLPVATQRFYRIIVVP